MNFTRKVKKKFKIHYWFYNAILILDVMNYLLRKLLILFVFRDFRPNLLLVKSLYCIIKQTITITIIAVNVKCDKYYKYWKLKPLY